MTDLGSAHATPSDDQRRLDAEAILNGFETMGRYLQERSALGEIAVYGGSAILLQFDWRTITQDVDAVVLNTDREGVVKDAIAYAGLKHDLPDDWLNNFVDGFTPETERPEFFQPFGTYPAAGVPGLRVVLARPEYLCAMKLKAIDRADPQDKDFTDAVRLARETGIDDADGLVRVFSEFYPDESLPPIALARLPELAEGVSCSGANPGGTP